MSTAAATAPQPQSIAYPYFVRRTRFQSLPVYTDIRNGRTRRQTIVRRIDGDVQALGADIAAEFGSDVVAVKNVSRQVVIKGDLSREVREWLTQRGF
ncbi:mitochondrial 54S ribosomal protein img2 [Coemansia sp. RSA 552]|nr:mitochondrial 54S ribosomal protein img2 [Coemansia sp. RSA 552]